MNYREDYFFDLVKKQLAGASNGQEDAYIQEMIQQYPEAREIYEDLQAMHGDRNFLLSDEEKEQSYQTLLKGIGEKEKKRRRGYAMAAVVFSLVVVVSAMLFLNKDEKVARVDPAEGAVVLQLANGERVALPHGMSDRIDIWAATLEEDSLSLNFRAASGSQANNTLFVPAGETYKVVLEDSTVVHLNSMTKITFPFLFSEKREIAIEGEAFIEVRRNEGRPFIVRTSGGSIQVLGTSFNVNTYDSGAVRVALIQGAVRLTSVQEEKVIKPGELAVLQSDQGISVWPFDAADVLSWRNGIYSFDEQPLEKIISVMERWFAVKVECDPNLREKRYTGVLDRHHGPEFFLNNLKSVEGNIEYDIKGDTIRIGIHRR
ncbi:FecR family protein [Chitinophaga japonensis]|uniref:FecR family protein n=1 Tax=Chitinophaga japonensis TaxID=104662 RepID=A0A562T3Z6_CHIJA|nr:FecR domain-containing protein [Chitinophaga japonensis]TWI87786.1 FecR family protein [Chitinophaga japonensis]